MVHCIQRWQLSHRTSSQIRSCLSNGSVTLSRARTPCLQYQYPDNQQYHAPPNFGGDSYCKHDGSTSLSLSTRPCQEYAQGRREQRLLSTSSPKNTQNQAESTPPPNRPTMPLPELNRWRPASQAKSAAESPSEALHCFAVDMKIDARWLAPMIKTLRDARKLHLPDTAVTYPAAAPKPERQLFSSNERYLVTLSQDLKAHWEQKLLDPSPAHMSRLEERSQLPVMAPDMQAEMLSKLQSSDVLIVRANTGSGKTTQVPQIILDEAIKAEKGAFCNIIITQPRRISATSVARRVASERDERIGESVGFAVRFNSRPPIKKGSLLYCTSGMLLKRLQSRQDALKEFSHVIIDEVHERNADTDCTLTILRDLISEQKAEGNPYPKIILMSATIDSKFFDNYFSTRQGEVSLDTSTINVEGRLFPVHEHYLHDFLPALKKRAMRNSTIRALLEDPKVDKATLPWIEEERRFSSLVERKEINSEADPKSRFSAIERDIEPEDFDDAYEAEHAPATESKAASMSPLGLVTATIMHILEQSDKGDVLVFLVGMSDLDRTAELLRKRLTFADNDHPDAKLHFFKLHSMLAETNDDVFEELPPGCRRVILSTNIAETSITLPDVEHVIDVGKERQCYYDAISRVDTYPADWISKSNRRQRSGRAGRVQSGHYYALFSRQRAESFAATTTPELVRQDLARMSLAMKTTGDAEDLHSFYARVPSPPDVSNIDYSVAYLKKLGALTQDEAISPLGRILSQIPAHPSQIRLALLGLLFGCFEPMLIMACTDVEDPLIMSPSAEAAKINASRRQFAAGTESDAMAQINAFKEYEKAEREGDFETMEHLERDRFINANTYRYMSRVARQICEELHFAGLFVYPSPDQSAVASIPSMLNRNADCVPLIKALSMGLFNSDIAMRHKRSSINFNTVGDTRSLLLGRSVNYEPKFATRTSSRKLYKPNDMMAFITRREDTETAGLYWLTTTSMVTPLMSILFGHTLQATERGFLVNNWINVEVDKADDTGAEENVEASKLPLATAKLVIHEFRKAFDRFCVLAFTDLELAARQHSGPTIDSIDSRGTASTKALMAKIRKDVEDRKAGKQSAALAKPKTWISRSLADAFTAGLLRVLKADDEALHEQFAKDVPVAEALEAERKVNEEKKRERRKRVKRIPLDTADGGSQVDHSATVEESLEKARATA